MNRSVLNRTLLNTSVLCQSRLNQSGLASQRGKSGGIPAAIRSAMVLWYDIARQGCSNETMQENPVLRDLSGNGHDATCYNFGWSGMSGIGGYMFDFESCIHVNGNATYSVESSEKVVITSITGNQGILIDANRPHSSMKIKVSGDFNGGGLMWYFNNFAGSVTIKQEGIYIIPDDELTDIYGLYGGIVTDSCNITVEILPLYPGALVSDGVDDYAYVEGLPILTKEEGYTVVAKRRILEDPATNIKDAGWINKRKTLDTGAFVIDFFNSVSKDWNTRSFSSNIPIGGSFDIDGEFIYQTSISYNGVQDLKPGDFEDTDTLYLFAALGMGAQISAAFYSLALFDRDLTAEEIEWVKTNLITA